MYECCFLVVKCVIFSQCTWTTCLVSVTLSVCFMSGNIWRRKVSVQPDVLRQRPTNGETPAVVVPPTQCCLHVCRWPRGAEEAENKERSINYEDQMILRQLWEEVDPLMVVSGDENSSSL